MTNKKTYFLTTALWGNVIGYFLARVIGKFYDTKPSWDDSSLLNGLILLIFFTILGLPGAYYYAKDIKENGNLNPFGFAEAIYINSVFAFFLGILGLILGRIQYP